MEQIAIICGILGFFGGFMGLGIGIWAVIEVKALQKSTHAVQYVPVSTEQPINNEKVSREFEKAGAMAAPFDFYPTDEVIL
jgi:ABC-type antimicrobial peptide transport system permease subunit